uniref:hypothetical protein n=1 Tax=uncultured Sphingomonas sp. TaxID=158754 RepID=UPI0025F400DE|nr:hypothetical protein [uncultured Sphingomonas sp.]
MAPTIATPPDRSGSPGPPAWWETRWFAAAAILLSVVPLLYPPLPPLVDLLGHIGRYRVQLDLGSSASLQRFYDYHWAIVGNLGVDLLIWPLGKLLGLEPAVKLIVLLIPPTTVAGMLWVAREVHGRLPPTVLFALPFAYGHHFLFGFVNYALSMALAFLAFGLWLRLGRLGKVELRAALFVPIGILIWLCHAFGWGMLGLLAFSAEAVRQHDRGRGWLLSAPRAAFHCLSLAVPLLLMVLWRGEGGGQTADWFNWTIKGRWIEMALRDRWYDFDRASVAVVGLVFVLAVVHPRLTLSRMLFFTLLVLCAAFAVLPRIIFGSAYADMRLVPFLLAVAMLAIRFRREPSWLLARAARAFRTELRFKPEPPAWFAWSLAIAALAFFLVRTASVTASLAIAANDHRRQLAALDHIPMGARVVSMVGLSCRDRSWPMWRNAHLGGLVVARRLGFSNDHWETPGAKLLTVTYEPAGNWKYDPSNLVRHPTCQLGSARPVGPMLANFPRGAFDYLWLIDPPPFDGKLLGDARMVWQGPNGSALYRLPGGGATQRP